MITIKSQDISIREIEQDIGAVQARETVKSSEEPNFTTSRPDIVEAKVYKLRSGLVKFSVYVTLGYIFENGRKRPIEIFINSKDLTKSAEYSVLTRLISAIFRRTNDPSFILEELRSIYDPNGGYHKNGRYIRSFYSEIADIVEQFFYDIDLIANDMSDSEFVIRENVEPSSIMQPNCEFRVCPDCSDQSLKTENGCDVCMNPECGYSKCDK
ncbi:hypothetical protein H8D59_02920 [bacterium]|nr:hypothetical protein [bacterium]MBL7052178.1 hypothetical protein [Candidatus Neomarinimicrobiota bacterium]